MDHVELPDGRTLQVAEGGDPAGVLLVIHHGTPGGAVLAPWWSEDAAGRGLRLVTYARPGYGTSSRHPGRSVADVVGDVAALADACGADRFLTWGASGGGPHALACAALLPDRVVAAASLAGVAPYDADGLDFLAGMGEGNIEEFGVVVEQGEPGTRALAERERAGLLQATHAQVADAMAPFLTDLDATELRGPLGEWLVAEFHSGLEHGVDGWVDDDLMFVRPWGFAVEDIRVPTLVWQGRQDAMVPFAHGQWLAAHVPGADVRLTEDDGHLTLLSRRLADVHGWLRAQWDRAAAAAPAP
jgi:pimeloyl-ACP methyl ester carboxylesterase